MVRAIQPLPPPSAKPFRQRRLRLLASAAALGQRFLVGGVERFRLFRLMLRFGVRIVVQGARRSSAAAARSPEQPQAWRQVDDGLEDFATLDASHLAAFEALSASLAAIETATRIRLWDTIVNP
jgi:hypothetical protein